MKTVKTYQADVYFRASGVSYVELRGAFEKLIEASAFPLVFSIMYVQLGSWVRATTFNDPEARRTVSQIRAVTIALAKELARAFGLERIWIVFSDDSIVLGKEDLV